MKNHAAWLTIDLKAIDYNIKQLKRLFKKEVSLMAVVKGDAYGHGLIAVAQQAIKSGASHLAVIKVEEALLLRRRGIIHPIVLLASPSKEDLPELVKNKIALCVGNVETYRAILKVATIMNRRVKLHIKIDTGLNRLGFTTADEVLGIIKKIQTHRRVLEIEGIYSQLVAGTMPDPSLTSDQVLAFEKILKKITALDVEIPVISLANSASALVLPTTRFNCVRIGIAMYGIWPSRGVELWCKRSARARNLRLRPALSYKTKLVAVRRVKAGSYLGYDRTFQAKSSMTVGVIPVGYYDGYDHALSNMGFALLKGSVVPIVGQVGMNSTILDISRRSRAKIGDEVTLIGKSGNKEITATDIADWADTVSHEILVRLPSHLPRIYKS